MHKDGDAAVRTQLLLSSMDWVVEEARGLQGTEASPA